MSKSSLLYLYKNEFVNSVSKKYVIVLSFLSIGSVLKYLEATNEQVIFASPIDKCHKYVNLHWIDI